MAENERFDSSELGLGLAIETSSNDSHELSVGASNQSMDVRSSESQQVKDNTNDKTLDFQVDVDALKTILSCTVCHKVRRTVIYQCNIGHLICAGCFDDVLQESQQQNELAFCQKCTSTISQDQVVRNVAVETAISQLPIACPHCSALFRSDNLEDHKSNACERRPTSCENILIGCQWVGPFNAKITHELTCKKKFASGAEILNCLTKMDLKFKTVCEQIERLLSMRSILFLDIQLKRIAGKFLVSKFSAFDQQWRLEGELNVICRTFDFSIHLLSKVESEINLHFLLVQGPRNDIVMRSDPGNFQFSNDHVTSNGYEVKLCSEDAVTQFSNSDSIYCRVFLFLEE